MATEADLIQKFKDLDIPVGADFEELIHAAFASANLADQINSKADDSKVVHTADMRKPANRVASIDEVNVKADDSKVSALQTQVDNSAVGTNLLYNSRGKFQPNTSKIDNEYIGDYAVYRTEDVDIYMTQGQQYTVHADASSGLVWSGTHDTSVESNRVVLWLVNITNVNAIISDANTGTGTTFTWNFPSGTYYLRVNTYKSDNSGYVENVKIEKGSVATDWCPNPDDKVNVSDMRKPASDVAGIEEVNVKADDSKVAHLSGANNFDTTPTVNNNPLLLASSLPSDLARTSQQTNFTNGLQSGGVNVATAADLKSVADKAWYMKSLPDVPALKNISLLYQVDNTNKKMNIVLNGSYSSVTAADSTGLLIADFSDILQGISGISIKSNTNKGGFYCYDQSMQQSPNVVNNVNIVFSGTKLYMNTGSNTFPRLQISGADYLCLMYGSTISYTELV